MKQFILMLNLFVLMAVLVACDDSASSGDGTASTNTSEVKGSFPPNGDEGFYCLVTDGKNADGSYWKQIMVNIPKYKGHVEKITFDENGNGTQYYEDAHYYTTPYEQRALCLEYEDAVKKQSQKRNYTETYCQNGVYYFVITFQNASVGNLSEKVSWYESDCKDYEQKWKDGDYDEAIERRTSR